MLRILYMLLWVPLFQLLQLMGNILQDINRHSYSSDFLFDLSLFLGLIAFKWFVLICCFFLHLDHRRVLARLPGGLISGSAAHPAPQLLPGHHTAHYRGCYSRAEHQRILCVQSASKEIAVFVHSSIPHTVSWSAVTNTARIMAWFELVRFTFCED